MVLIKGVEKSVPKVILASASPRRKEILENLGISFTCVCPDVEEVTDQKTADGVVRDISRQKGIAVANVLKSQGQDVSDTLIIAADTAVVLDMEILGKPKNKESACKMLRALSGRTHFVTTGVTLIYGEQILTENELTKICFATLTDEQIKGYVATGECMDKAGAYAIQGKAAPFITRIEGDYFNVVGFPVHRFSQMVSKLGLTIQPDGKIVE